MKIHSVRVFVVIWIIVGYLAGVYVYRGFSYYEVVSV